MQQIEDKTSDFNRYYHAAGDTVDHMDAAYWDAMMRGLVATIASWAELVPDPWTPTATAPPTATPAPSVTATRRPMEPPAPTPSATTAATAPPPRHRAYLPMAYRGRR